MVVPPQASCPSPLRSGLPATFPTSSGPGVELDGPNPAGSPGRVTSASTGLSAERSDPASSIPREQAHQVRSELSVQAGDLWGRLLLQRLDMTSDRRLVAP